MRATRQAARLLIVTLALAACGQNAGDVSGGYATHFVRESGQKLSPALSEFNNKAQMTAAAQSSTRDLERASVASQGSLGTPQECQQLLLDSTRDIGMTVDGAEGSVSSQVAEVQVSVSTYKTEQDAMKRLRDLMSRCPSLVFSLPQHEVGQKMTPITDSGTACPLDAIFYKVAHSDTSSEQKGDDPTAATIPNIRTSYAVAFYRGGYMHEMRYSSPVGTPDRAGFDKNVFALSEVACSLNSK